jgi:hypothetical protein
VLVRFNSPLLTNPRMENLFERAPFGCVLENYGAKSGAIQVAVGRKNAEGELVENVAFNIVKIDKVMRGLIGIEELSAGHELAQAINERTLAC